MPLKKKEEVCGKPNQYDLKTLEYNWRELPDNHIQVPERRPRVRQYAAFAGHGVADQGENPKRDEQLPFPGARARGGGNVSPTPLPSPSKPLQEELRLRLSPEVQNCRRDHVAEILGGGGYDKRGARPLEEARRGGRASPAVVDRVPMAPKDRYSPRVGDHNVSPSPPPFMLQEIRDTPATLSSPSSQQYVGKDSNHLWSHEDIKRAVYANILEAQRCYLR